MFGTKTTTNTAGIRSLRTKEISCVMPINIVVFGGNATASPYMKYDNKCWAHYRWLKTTTLTSAPKAKVFSWSLGGRLLSRISVLCYTEYVHLFVLRRSFSSSNHKINNNNVPCLFALTHGAWLRRSSRQ